jgi:tripartite motif-containing protein 71
MKWNLKIALVIVFILICTTACFYGDSMSGDPSSLQNCAPGDLVSELSFKGEIRGLKDETLAFPVAACQDASGNTYVLDIYSTDGIVKVFDDKGEFMYKLAPQVSPEAQPVDVAVDGDGNIYIADLGVGEIFKYNTDGLTGKIKPSEDFYPRSITIDSNDALIVMSYNKVYKFSKNQKQELCFGKTGQREGEFGVAGSEFYVGPNGVDVDKYGNIYVADTLNCRLQKFDANGNFLRCYEMDESDAPQDVAVDSKGYLYVATYSGSLIKLDQDGKIVRQIPQHDKDAGNMDMISIAGGNGDTILVIEPERHTVTAYCDEKKLYSLGTNMGESFIYPHGISVFGESILILGGDPYYYGDLNNKAVLFHSDGDFIKELVADRGIHKDFAGPRDSAFLGKRLYVLDIDRIYVFDIKGRFIESFGERGENPGQFGVYDNYGQEQGPAAIYAVGGKLMISDTHNDRIQIITVEGSSKGGFCVDSPGAITVDGSGFIYIVVPSKGRILKYSSKGEKLMEFGGPGTLDGEFHIENFIDVYQGPDGIAVDEKNGIIYVSDTAAHRIQAFDLKGKFLKTIGEFGSGEGQFYYPRKLVLDEQGSLWVADTGNHRVVKLGIN